MHATDPISRSLRLMIPKAHIKVQSDQIRSFREKVEKTDKHDRNDANMLTLELFLRKFTAIGTMLLTLNVTAFGKGLVH